MLKSGLSTFNTGIRRVSKTHRNGFMDDLPTLPPFYEHFVKCLVLLRILNRRREDYAAFFFRNCNNNSFAANVFVPEFITSLSLVGGSCFSGPSCSKLTMPLVNDSSKFQT